MECIGQRLENGEPFVVTWHAANVTNLIISTESLTGANIEMRHAMNESSMIMDRSGTHPSVVLHNFAMVPWLKLRRDDTVLDRELKIAALITTDGNRGHRVGGRETNTPEEEREALVMDEKIEIPQPGETSIAQRSNAWFGAVE